MDLQWLSPQVRVYNYASSRTVFWSCKSFYVKSFLKINSENFVGCSLEVLALDDYARGMFRDTATLQKEMWGLKIENENE